jgi:hypothetical protein
MMIEHANIREEANVYSPVPEYVDMNGLTKGENMDTVTNKSIHLKEYRKGHFTGVTIRDQDLLRYLTGTIYFETKDYDRLLAIVGNYGYDMMTYYGQEEVPS